MKIETAIKRLLEIVEQLEKQYEPKKFTLDGRLVGDLGEIIVEKNYRIKLYDKIKKHYDAETEEKEARKVQIKATMKKNLTFPRDFTPQYYIGVKIKRNGKFDEIFNGPGQIIRTYLNKNRNKPSSNYYSIGLNTLCVLNKTVTRKKRVAKRGT